MVNVFWVGLVEFCDVRFLGGFIMEEFGYDDIFGWMDFGLNFKLLRFM